MARSQQQPMIYFHSLELENVRCFGERQVLKLTDDKGLLAQWTLLLGDNGVEKTTLLTLPMLNFSEHSWTFPADSP